MSLVSVVMEHNGALYLLFLPLKMFTIFFLPVENYFAEQALQTAFARFSQPFILRFPAVETKWMWALSLVPILHYLLDISWPKPASIMICRWVEKREPRIIVRTPAALLSLGFICGWCWSLSVVFGHSFGILLLITANTTKEGAHHACSDAWAPPDNNVC